MYLIKLIVTNSDDVVNHYEEEVDGYAMALIKYKRWKGVLHQLLKGHELRHIDLVFEEYERKKHRIYLTNNGMQVDLKLIEKTW